MGRLSAFCIQAKLGHPMQDVHLQGGNLLTGILNRWGVIHQNAGPWRRAAPKAQDGCGEADDSV